MPWLLYICIFFSDLLCIDMSLLLLTVTLRGVSNKHCLLPLFFIFPFSISQKVMNMEIFVKDFSGTTRPRILKFGTKLGNEQLYCVLKNQPHIAYQFLYLSIFLSL